MTVVSIRGNQVRIGFEAPLSVPIFRDELRHERASRAHRRRGHGNSSSGRPFLSDRDQRGLVLPVRLLITDYWPHQRKPAERPEICKVLTRLA